MGRLVVTEVLCLAVVFRAVHSYQGARERWETDRKTGLTDEEFRERVRYEMGIAGGGSLPEPWFNKYYMMYRGGTRPQIEIIEWDSGNRYVLKGSELLNYLRHAVGVGYPVPAGVVLQERLF